MSKSKTRKPKRKKKRTVSRSLTDFVGKINTNKQGSKSQPMMEYVTKHTLTPVYPDQSPCNNPYCNSLVLNNSNSMFCADCEALALQTISDPVKPEFTE